MPKDILRCCCAFIVPIVIAAAAILAPTNASAQSVEVVRVDGVNGSNSPAGLGDDWGADAYRYLQDGLDRAQEILDLPDPPELVEVWVLGDETPVVYRVDHRAAAPWGTNDPDETVLLKPNIKIFGGFHSASTIREDRRPHQLITILSGEIGTPNDYSDNSHHVVSALDAGITLENCRLDGFRVNRGNGAPGASAACGTASCG